MRAVVQRVQKAQVFVDNRIVGRIERGLLVLLAVHKDDKEDSIARMGDKLIALRIFADQDRKMNLSVDEIGGSVLVVSQFTLYAETSKGSRPSFIGSAQKEKAIEYYDKLIEYIKQRGTKVESGEFAAMMEVELVNDGPVTIILDC